MAAVIVMLVIPKQLNNGIFRDTKAETSVVVAVVVVSNVNAVIATIEVTSIVKAEYILNPSPRL